MEPPAEKALSPGNPERLRLTYVQSSSIALTRLPFGSLQSSPEAQIGRSYNGRGLARHPQEIFRKKVLDTENGF